MQPYNFIFGPVAQWESVRFASERSWVQPPSGPPKKAVKFYISQLFCNFLVDSMRMRTKRFWLVLEIVGNIEPKWFASKNRIWKVKEAGIKIDTSLFSVYKTGETPYEWRTYLGGNEMPRVNRKSSLGHWYAPVYAPEYPRDPPKPHGCTRFVRCKGCPYPGHGFVCWQGEDTCLRTRMNEINGLEENEDDDSGGTE